MIGEIIGLGIGLCVDSVLKASIPVGKTVGAKIVRGIGSCAISYAVGQEIDRAIQRASGAYTQAVDQICGYEIEEEEVEAE